MKKNIRVIICIAVIVVVLIGAALILSYAYKRYVYISYPLKYESDIKAASEKYDVDEALIYAVIKTESNFDPNAESSAGARGLMQLMPETFEWIQTYYTDDDGYTTDDLYNYKVNIDYGTHLLSILLDMYEDEGTAICAYNAGIGRVDGWLESSDYSDDGITLKNIPIEETEQYLEKVRISKNAYIRLYFQNEADLLP